MKKKQYKAVFRARIDFSDEEPQQKPLHSGGSYYLDKHSESQVSYTDIVNESVRINQ
jgi:hypothetical protein